MHFLQQNGLLVALVLGVIASWFTKREKRLRKEATDAFLAAFKAGDYEGALEAVKGVRKAAVFYYRQRACIFLQVGKLDEAEAAFREAIALAEHFQLKIRGGSTGAGRHKSRKQIRLSAVTWQILGEVHLEQERYHEAMQCFETSLQEWPDRGQSHCVIAETWLRRGENPNEALKWATLAVEEERVSTLKSKETKAANLAEALATRAWAVAVALHDVNEVDRLVQEAALTAAAGTGRVATSARVNYHAGLAYRALGDGERSTRHFRKAAEIDPLGR